MCSMASGGRLRGSRESNSQSSQIKGMFMAAGGVLVNPGCWTMLKGGITADSSGPAELYFVVV
jgi:hypothetical protein